MARGASRGDPLPFRRRCHLRLGPVAALGLPALRMRTTFRTTFDLAHADLSPDKVFEKAAHDCHHWALGRGDKAGREAVRDFGFLESMQTNRSATKSCSKCSPIARTISTYGRCALAHPDDSDVASVRCHALSRWW